MMGMGYRGWSWPGLLVAVVVFFCVAETVRGNEVPEEVRFVVFGDSQFSRPHVFERMVHEANLLRPHFVTGVGDMIHGYTDDKEQLRYEWRWYKKQLEPLTMPFHPVPGNHDVVLAEMQEVYEEVWGPDKYFYSYDYGPVHCIVLDSFHKGDEDRIMDYQIEWLKNDLEAYAARHGGRGSEELAKRTIFVFLHSPMWRYHDEQPGYFDWKKVHEILVQYPVRMVFGGHTHEYVWEKRDGIEYVVVNSAGTASRAGERAGSFSGFLHVSVVDGNVRTAVIVPDSVLPVDTVDSEDREKNPAYSLRGGTIRIPKWDPGEPLDMTVSVPVENRLDQEREIKLRWRIPRHAGVSVEPQVMWIDAGPEELVTAEFRMTADAAPERELMPTLRAEARNVLPSGVVSRDWELRYRRELARAEAGEELITTAIELDKEYVFPATFTLFVPPRATAARWEGPIEIDGVFDEPGWKRAEPVTDFKHSQSEDPAPYATWVRYLYDEDYLYVGVWMEEPNPEHLKADAGGEIPLTWNDDDIELFFDPTRTARDHTRLFQNAAGTRFNAFPIEYATNRYVDTDYESAIHIGEDYWTIEMRIPWSDIYEAGQPEPGTIWAINIWRHRQQSSPARFYWAVDSYNQGRYGFLEFE